MSSHSRTDVLARVEEIERQRQDRIRSGKLAGLLRVSELLDHMAHRAGFDDEHDFTRVLLARCLDDLLQKATDAERGLIATDLQKRASEWLTDDLKHSDPVIQEAAAIATLAYSRGGYLNAQLLSFGKWGAACFEYRRQLSAGAIVSTPRQFRAGVELNDTLGEGTKLPADLLMRAFRASEDDQALPWGFVLPALLSRVVDKASANTMVYLASNCLGVDVPLVRGLIPLAIDKTPADDRSSLLTRLRPLADKAKGWPGGAEVDWDKLIDG